jgi:hypothetical protein
MLSGNLLKSLRDLNRADKLYAVQVLVSDLAQEEANLLQPGIPYEVSSPYDSFVGAAQTMLEFLDQSKQQQQT